ncbi:hypothetical protein TOT_030000761 [Theileria orientalis strain Shintoku]|uniref:Uncharacterized protein n=1 Tax=Theileria orientalis strain Shintoku TaxID=869250 RepID=J4DPY2_THEOR|nr:hypothetical protein TOT_030000761 [Theileria orientalis strain Shintoku]BAM41499.1 hypothetical protein TOT_030000761 [Theileria orientalis strain Shintoku]|eukprot:XP_009691800.1 hypothetical protein TOT_030000761 [Theileria orientalis strain Shintoku]
MVYNIHIQTNRTNFYVVEVKHPLSNKVDIDEPYDKLSKKFNRYTHIIKYEQRTYNAKDYTLCLDNPNAWFYRKFFYLYEPEKQIISVDIFFQSNDVYKNYPLIVGFNEVGGTSYYYTYYFLRGKGSSTGTINNRRWIGKDDLLTRLIEERGLHVSESYNKFVIRLGEKPKNAKPFLYPKSGHNTERITVTKEKVSQLDDFVKYKHSIDRRNNVEAFYISFDNNSLYMFGNHALGKLQFIDAYYKHNDKLFLIYFKFQKGGKLYTFSDFLTDLNKTDPVKNISKLKDYKDKDITNILIHESKKLDQLITFEKRVDSHENENLSKHDGKLSGKRKDIQIYIYRTGGSYTIGDALVPVQIAQEKPWDKLSKAFTKYTHTIKYPYRSSVYEPSEYYITVYGHSGSINKFTYKEPKSKVHDVEVYFWADDDPSSKEPLIVGFISRNWRERELDLGRYSSKGCKSISGEGSKCYYTWTYLKGREFIGDVDTENAIMEKDLINGLLEVLGTRERRLNRKNKLVIRLDEQPVGGEGRSAYPESRYFKDRNKQVTVTKVTNTGVLTGLTGYDKYEHTVDSRVSVQDFYVTYGNNSMFIMTKLGSGRASLSNVTSYYKSTGNFKNLVLITFTFTGKSELYVYTYYDLVTNLQGVKTWSTDVKKTIRDTDAISGKGSDLQGKLQQEREKLKPLITFEKGDNRSKNKNISTRSHNIGRGTFIKVVMTANTDDGPGGSSVGPWNVYNSKLFTLGVNTKIDEKVLTSRSIFTTVTSGSNKYQSISVFYTLKDNKALLVEFDKGDGSGGISGTKTYFKRKDKKGSFGASETINTSNTEQLERKLTEIAKEAKVIEGSSSSATGHGLGGSTDLGAGAKGAPLKASPSSSRATSFSRSTLTQSRQSATTNSRTSGHTESGSSVSTGQGHEYKAKSPKSPAQKDSQPGLSPPQNGQYSAQKGQDTGPLLTSLPPTPSRSGPGSIVTHSHGGQTDHRGEMGTSSQNALTHEGPSEERVDQNTYYQVQNRSPDLPSRSSSDLKPLSADSQIGYQQMDEDSDEYDDESTTKTVKIAGGVATTAIGAGSIGAGGYYAEGVLSLIKWLV